jgi:hypothetical protein
MDLATPEQVAFWLWFHGNGDRVYRAMIEGDDDRESASDEAHEQLSRVHQGLVFVFGRPHGDDDREFVISADGKPELVDAVKSLLAAAPPLPGWRIVGFRPRSPNVGDFALQIHDEKITPEDVWFSANEGDGGLALTLHVRGLNDDNRGVRGLGAVLLMDHALGEHDALTMIGSLEDAPLPEAPAEAGLRPLVELPAVVDAFRDRAFPPPGQVPLPAECPCTLLQGTIEDRPAFILLNAALRPFAAHPSYDGRVIVSISFNETNDDGLPATGEELDAAQDLGDAIAKALGAGQQALHAVTITTDGRRDLILYTSDVHGTLARFEKLRPLIDSHRVEAAADFDTFWGAYRCFI